DPAGDFGAQLAAYEAEPRLVVRYDVGAGPGANPGTPVAGFSATYPAWPPPVIPTTWYLGPHRRLADAPAARGRPDEYDDDPRALPRTLATSRAGGATGSRGGTDPTGLVGLFADPTYDWRPLPEGTGLAY